MDMVGVFWGVEGGSGEGWRFVVDAGNIFINCLTMIDS